MLLDIVQLVETLLRVLQPSVRAHRDKTRMLLAEALTLAAGAVPGADAGAVAVDVELAMLRQVHAGARALLLAALCCCKHHGRSIAKGLL